MFVPAYGIRTDEKVWWPFGAGAFWANLTTVCGWIAVGQIRQSAGKLRGLGLAVFDGLLFLLLALDAGLWWLWTIITSMSLGGPAMGRGLHGYDPAHMPREVGIWIMLSGIILILAVDFLIIRAVWRAVNGTAASSLAANTTAQPGHTRWHKAWISVLLAFAIAIPLKIFVLGSYVIAGSSVEPELTAGSRILVWKPARTFATGDIIAYDHEGKTFVARVVSAADSAVTVNRNGQPDEAVPRSRVNGKVISVYWRASSQAAQTAKPDAIEMKVTEQLLETTIRALSDTHTKLAEQLQMKNETHPDVIELRAKLSALEHEAERLRAIIRQGEPKQ
jgi:hypothetical protein